MKKKEIYNNYKQFSYQSPSDKICFVGALAYSCTLQPSEPVLTAPSAAGSASIEVIVTSDKKKN